MTQADVFLGLGSNLGDRMRNLDTAMKSLASRMHIVSTSRVYESEPVGYEKQPTFLNMACHTRTTFTPMEALRVTQEVEMSVGRYPTFTDGPRIIDIDLLLYGDICIQCADLVIPHPRIAERMFVLVPLAEIAPHAMHPLLGKSIRQLLDETGDRHWVRVVRGEEDVPAIR